MSAERPTPMPSTGLSSNRNEVLFHTMRTGTGETSCGKQPDEVYPNEAVNHRRLPPDARPCCRCFGLTRQQSQEWKQQRMQAYMATLLETRSRLSKRDTVADLASLLETLNPDDAQQDAPVAGAIDRVTGCRNCGAGLATSPSDDFCSERCQQTWVSTRGEPLTGYQEPSTAGWSSDQHRYNPRTHYEIREHGDGYVVYDVLHDYPVANIDGEIVVWPDRQGPSNHMEFLYETGWEPRRPSPDKVESR